MKELEIINSGTDKFPFYQILDGTNEVAATHRLEIAKQLVDSFNTAQKCGLLPSELLKQRDELKEALRNACKFIKCTPHLKHDEDRPRGLERWELLAEAAIKNTER